MLQVYIFNSKVRYLAYMQQYLTPAKDKLQNLQDFEVAWCPCFGIKGMASARIVVIMHCIGSIF